MPDLREKVLALAVQHDGVPFLKLEQDERRSLALAVAALVAKECAMTCHVYAVDQRIHRLAGRGAIHCSDAIRQLAETLK